MEKLDAYFEEKTSKLSALVKFQKEGADLMEIDGKGELRDENMAGGEVENLDDDEEDLDQFKIVHHKKGTVRKVLRTSERVGDKNARSWRRLPARRKWTSKVHCHLTQFSILLTIFILLV
jgi:hypothetical protein